MYRIGIDLGGTNIAFGLVDENGRLIRKESIVTDRNANDIELTRQMAKFSLEFIEKCGLKESDIISIGIGCPGACDDEKGILILTVNVPFRNTNMRKIFKEYTDIPLHLANDANCAALGEVVCGGAKGYRTSLTITLGTGVGGGVIIDGKIYTGFNGGAGELGHMVIRRGGEKCGCGRKGCFEAYASATAIIRETKKALEKNPDSEIAKLCGGNPDEINAKTAFDAWRNGDKTGTGIVKKYIADLSEGIINYINIFQPEIILLGGGVSKEGDNLLVPLRKMIRKHAYGSKFLKMPRVERAVLGNDAGIIGAAMLG